MQVKILALDEVREEVLKYAVIVASFQNKWIFVRHRERSTWEIPGGRRELDETIYDTAKRELYEETGATAFQLQAICDYSVNRQDNWSYGRIFYSQIEGLGPLPDMEIEEVRFFDGLPDHLTYPEIQPLLFNHILNWKQNNAR
ncbi:NUDIX hydrolase [Alkaliphilus crotonatoxidans]